VFDLSRKLILHFGIHKTGTTTLQEHIRRHSTAFSANGLHYAPLDKLISGGLKAHHHLAHFLALPEINDEDLNLLKSGLTAIQSTIAEEHALFISSEALYRHTIKDKASYLDGRELYLRRVANVFQNFDIMVVVVLRRPEDYIRSLYQESIFQAYKPSGKTSSFSGFRRREMGRTLRFASNLNLLKKVFSNVKVLLYEDLVAKGDICTSFYDEIGWNIENLLPVQSARISLNPIQSQIKLFINSFAYPESHKFRYLKWIKSPAVSKLIIDFYGTSNYDFWESQDALESFRREIKPEIETLRELWFPSRDIIFPEPDQRRLLPVPELNDRFKSALLHLALKPLGGRISH